MAWKLSRASLKQPTPAGFVFWVRIYTAVMIAFISWMPTASYIGHKFQDISTSIIGLTVTIANIILPFFGVTDVPDKVPVEQVTSIEENPKP